MQLTIVDPHELPLDAGRASDEASLICGVRHALPAISSSKKRRRH